MSNPYEPPGERPARDRPEPPISWMGAFGVIAASGAVFGIAGMVVGLALGVAMPGYFRGVSSDAVDPLQVGMGLGLSQGLFAGVAVASALVAAMTTWRGRSREVERPYVEPDDFRAELARIAGRPDHP